MLKYIEFVAFSVQCIQIKLAGLSDNPDAPWISLSKLLGCFRDEWSHSFKSCARGNRLSGFTEALQASAKRLLKVSISRTAGTRDVSKLVTSSEFVTEEFRITVP